MPATVINLKGISAIEITGATSVSVASGVVSLTVSGGGTPGGSNTDLQYNNSGSFGGFADGTSHQVLHGGRSFSAVDLAADVTGILPKANGGTGVDLSASGSATAFLAQDASHVISARSLVAADYVTMVGDSGSGGVKGAVPAPTAGDAAAGKFLKADSTWAVPAGGGGGTFANAEIPTGAINGINQTFVLAHTPTNSSLRFYWNGVYQVVGGSPPASITLATATVTCTTFTPQIGDSVVAFYQY